MYIAPALIVMLVVIAYPIYYTVVLSFLKRRPVSRCPTGFSSGSTIT